MKFSAALFSIVLLAASAVGAPVNQKRCKSKTSTAAAATTSTAVLVASTSVHSTTAAASTSVAHTTAAASTSHVSSTHAASTTKAASTSKAVTTHTSSAAPAKNTSSNSGSGIKRGLSYNDVSLTKAFSTSKVSWAYNWAAQPGGNLASGVNFFPMLWGADSGKTSNWIADAKAAIKAGSTHLLFLNEPDLGSQSNVDPKTAAKLWMQYMQPFAGQATLVGPAITNGGAPLGTAWLDQFMDACKDLGCQVDAIAGHIYGSASNPDYYKTYISNLASRYGKPLLMTEIGVSDSSTSVSQQEALINELVPFLDGLQGVTHYAWFMAAKGLLVNADASLSAIGQAYQNAA